MRWWSGRTGVGKSTLLGAINGLVPHFTGGTLAGRVTRRRAVHRATTRRANSPGWSASSARTRWPGSSPTRSRRNSPTAWSSSASPPQTMRKRVEETLDLLGIAGLRGRTLRTLSGGQQQRVAIGSVLAAGSRVLVLDEPTSALDPTSAEEVLGAILRLVHDLGVTAVIAEHRMERVVEYADRVVLLTGDGRVEIGAPAEMMASTTVAPPVVGLAKLLGWQPLPLSVRSARRLAGAAAGTAAGGRSASIGQRRTADGLDRDAGGARDGRPRRPRDCGPTGIVVTLRASGRRRRRRPAGRARRGGRADGPQRVRQVEPALGAHRGRAAHGRSGRDRRGRHRRGSTDAGPGARRAGAADARPICSTWTPSPPSAPRPMRNPSAAGQLRGPARPAGPGDRPARAPARPVRGATAEPGAGGAADRRAAGAAARRADPRPGLRGQTRAGARSSPNWPPPDGRCWCPPTTSSSSRRVAGRVVVMAEGEIVADGPAQDVIGSSPMFAPQVAKVLAPQPVADRRTGAGRPGRCRPGPEAARPADGG